MATANLVKLLNKSYKELYDGTIDIIIGTQVIAKGLDLPNLRTVGVIQADAGLALPDFSASERTFQLTSTGCRARGALASSHYGHYSKLSTHAPCGCGRSQPRL